MADPDHAPLHAGAIVILAGGQSRRMGEDKAELRLSGSRLIDRAVALATHAGSPVVLSAPHDYATGRRCIPDAASAPAGPVGAIVSVARALKNDGRQAFTTVPVDAPFASVELIEMLSREPGCAIARHDGVPQPTFARWDVARVLCVDLPTDSPSLRWLARVCGAGAVDWPDAQTFTNCNTPDDLARARRMLNDRA